MTEQFVKVDQFGRKYIAAPRGKVLKAYQVCKWGFIEHVLVDECGLVFTSDKGGVGGGWRANQNSGNYRLVVFPNPVERGNEFDNTSWCFEEWYERNWLCSSWAWMYMKSADLKELTRDMGGLQ